MVVHNTNFLRPHALPRARSSCTRGSTRHPCPTEPRRPEGCLFLHGPRRCVPLLEPGAKGWGSGSGSTRSASPNQRTLAPLRVELWSVRATGLPCPRGRRRLQLQGSALPGRESRTQSASNHTAHPVLCPCCRWARPSATRSLPDRASSGSSTHPSPFLLCFELGVLHQHRWPRALLVANPLRASLTPSLLQVGKAFRNEIAPRSGLIRQREFTQVPHRSEMHHCYTVLRI